MPERLEREALRALEKWHRRFLILFESEPEPPITVLLYPTVWFHKSTKAPRWADGMYERDGLIRVTVGGISRLEAELERVLAHELAHAFITQRSGGRAPRWLQEGMAQSLSGAPPRELPSPPAATVDQLDHAGALAFTRSLQEQFGTEGLVSLLAALGDGAGEDEAFRTMTGASIGERYSRWREPHGVQPTGTGQP